MRWMWLPLLVLVPLVVGRAWLHGSRGEAAGYLVLGLLLVWWLSPWQRGRSTRHAEVMAMPPEDRRAVVYWRPGCAYCARLRRVLGGERSRARWVNIWQDREAAGYVRSVNGGDETVPTVAVDDVPATNPDPVALRDRLRTMA